jgi:hypothetical protein
MTIHDVMRQHMTTHDVISKAKTNIRRDETTQKKVKIRQNKTGQDKRREGKTRLLTRTFSVELLSPTLTRP